VALLEKIVNMNSGTFNPAGVLEVGKVLEREFQALGFMTRWVSMGAVKRAPSLVAERRGSRGKRILLIGHMDTVFEPSSPFQKFVRTDDIATGPVLFRTRRKGLSP
jgi:glutamate carboxypeptidase